MTIFEFLADKIVSELGQENFNVAEDPSEAEKLLNDVHSIEIMSVDVTTMNV